MSLKKMLKILKSEAVNNLIKKTLILEKLFQLLSQKKYDILLHISDEKENTCEKEIEDEIDSEVEDKDK
ncbi:hypothetical protein EMPG_11841, partial [Blastomyces silverae]